jgi:hypothetical protein
LLATAGLSVLVAAQAPSQGASQGGAPASFAIQGLSYLAQTFNNCGPASFAIAASAAGLKPDQAAAAAIMRPHEKDSHTALEDFPRAAAASGLSCAIARGLDSGAVKALIRDSIPVIVPTWHWDAKLGGMAHYLVIYPSESR